MLKSAPLKKLCRGTISVDDLRLEDFYLDITQKGVDMRIGLDIATMAERGIVTQIIICLLYTSDAADDIALV